MLDNWLRLGGAQQVRVQQWVREQKNKDINVMSTKEHFLITNKGRFITLYNILEYFTSCCRVLEKTQESQASCTCDRSVQPETVCKQKECKQDTLCDEFMS